MSIANWCCSSQGQRQDPAEVMQSATSSARSSMSAKNLTIELTGNESKISKFIVLMETFASSISRALVRSHRAEVTCVGSRGPHVGVEPIRRIGRLGLSGFAESHPSYLS